MRRGVTLVEVLVGLALAALLTAGLQSLLVQAYRTHARLLDERRANAALEVPLALLQQDLTALAMVNSLELRDNVLRLTGLVELAPESMQSRHALDVRYFLNAEGERSVLMREQSTLDQKDKRLQPISRNVKALRFEIFDGSTWHALWPLSNPRQPRAVRCTLTPASGDPQTLRIALQPLTWRSHAR